MLNVVYDANPDLIGLSERMNPPESITRDTVLVETGMKAGTVPISNGKTAKISGDTKSEFFAKNNIPGTTSYNFSIGATPQELKTFWDSYLSDQQNKEKEDKEKEEKEKKEKEDAEKEKAEKEKAEKEKEEAEKEKEEEKEETDN